MGCWRSLFDIYIKDSESFFVHLMIFYIFLPKQNLFMLLRILHNNIRQYIYFVFSLESNFQNGIRSQR